MALIPCRECTNQVSTEAANCPKCGAPVGIAATDHHAVGTRLMTTQLTSKALKRQQLIAWLIIIASIIGFASSEKGADFTWPSIWLLTLLTGMIWVVVLGIRRWWHHG